MTARASDFMPASRHHIRRTATALALGSAIGWTGLAQAQSLEAMINAARQYDATYLSDTASAKAPKRPHKLIQPQSDPKYL